MTATMINLSPGSLDPRRPWPPRIFQNTPLHHPEPLSITGAQKPLGGITGAERGEI